MFSLPNICPYSFLVFTNLAQFSFFAQFSLSLQRDQVLPFSADDFHRLGFKLHGWLAVSPPCPSGLQLLIYPLLKVCKNKPPLFKHSEKKKRSEYLYVEESEERVKGDDKTCQLLFWQLINLVTSKLLYILLQDNRILSESFSFLQQSVCNQ